VKLTRIALYASLAGAFLTIACSRSEAAVTVSTLAGSGAIGVSDGPGASATFMMPAALAWDAQGRLVVIDAAAQRVRRVLADGSVETVAGGGDAAPGAPFVAGGFRDGTGSGARFNWPRGVAVGRDGTIYVADTGNHCIRAISPSGTVSVFAGSPAAAGNALGTRAQARFVQPMGLAIDAKGSLLVADPEIGLRKIDAAGNVSALPFGNRPFGVSIDEQNGQTSMYVADADGLLQVAGDKERWRLRSPNQPRSDPEPGTPKSAAIERRTAMDTPIGYPFAVTQFGENVFYGDIRTNAVRYSYPGLMLAKILAGGPTEDSSGEVAGFRDGDAPAARFNAPLGVAYRTDGTLAVADAGNRRIRLVHIDPAADLVETSAVLPSPPPSSSDYSIVFVTSSFGWYDSVAADSMTGLLTRQLVADRALDAQNLRPVARYVGFGSWEGTQSVADAVAELGLDKLVIMEFEMIYVTGSEDAEKVLAHPEVWKPRVIAQLRGLQKSLAAKHIHFVVMLRPIANEMSPNEVFSTRFGLNAMIPNPNIHDELLGALTESGVDFVDTYPDFRANAMQPTAPMSLLDGHLNVVGRRILVNALARGLEKIKPWRDAAR
jgi:DNA-binding beta-propeller fold protein YncE